MKRTNMIDELEDKSYKCNTNYDYNVCVHTREENGIHYAIVNSPNIHYLGENNENYVSKIFSELIKKIVALKKIRKVIVFGLGNNRITSDALGPKTLKNMLATRGLKFKYDICLVVPDVYAKTGIETGDIVSAITKKINPDLVIFIDTLATTSIERLGISFQVCSDGLVPGGGINELNSKIDRKTIGVECLTIGVPLLVYADDILNKKIKDKVLPDLILTPKEIDEYVIRCAAIIANALNSVFIPELTREEIRQLNI